MSSDGQFLHIICNDQNLFSRLSYYAHVTDNETGLKLSTLHITNMYRSQTFELNLSEPK